MKLHTLSRFGSFLGIFCLLPSVVLAQQDDEQEEQEAPVAQQPLPVEEVVVTGSRIRRNEFTSTSPITVITSETSALAGLLDTADILQNSTVATGQQVDDTFSGFVTDGGPGARSVALRGLGEQRTLVLVNGKRWGPSGIGGATNSVDLTAIPQSSIARYEILKDGASSIYGADAVAGVVNALTVQRFEGLVVNVEGFAPQAGGAENFVADATWGQVGPDWSFSVAAGYDKRNDLVRNQRDWASCDRRPRFTDQGGDGVIDNTSPETGEQLCFGSVYGFIVPPIRGWDWLRYEPSLAEPDPSNSYFSYPQGVGIPYFTPVPVHGWNPTSEDPEDPDPLWDNDGGFYRDNTWEGELQDIIGERELFSITSFADKDFDIGGRSANVYYEFYYNRRTSTFTFGPRQIFEWVPASNPTNPLGVYGPLGRFGGFRALPVLMTTEWHSPDNVIEIDRYNAFVGLQGDLSATWSYDTYLGFNHSNGTGRRDQILDDRVRASWNSTLDANGNLVCAEPTIPGCVPANPFSEDALLHGRLPADVLGFITKPTVQETTYSGYQLSAYATGRLFSMPNGEDVNAVIGVETRNEEIDDVPDPDAQTNNFWGFTTAGITRGEDTVREAFTEFEVPFLQGLAWAEELLLNGSGRWTDYDSYGSDTTYRVALDYQMIPQIRFRGTVGTSFRAPDLFEQFEGGTTGFVSGFLDPCVNYGETLEPDDIVYQNCAAQGLPPEFGELGVPGIEQTVGGNVGLLAETSDAWTAGVVIQPEPADVLGLSLALTWYEIELQNTVSSPSSGYIFSTCYNSTGLSHPFCGRIGPRDENGYVTLVNASRLNVGREFARGFDVDFVMEQSFPTFDLTIDGTVAILKEQTTELFEDEWNSVRRWGFPKWTGVLDVLLDYRDWRFFWRANFIGHTDSEEPVYDPGTTNVDRMHWTDNHWEHTFTVRWTNADWTVLGTVRNIFDKQPPLVADGVPRNETTRIFNTLPGVGYDLFGRSFVLQVAREFD